MSWIGWTLSLLTGVLCAAVAWRLYLGLAPRRLRYLQPYQPPQQRPAQEP